MIREGALQLIERSRAVRSFIRNGRPRHPPACQICGNTFASTDVVLLIHKWARPPDGYHLYPIGIWPREFTPICIGCFDPHNDSPPLEPRYKRECAGCGQPMLTPYFPYIKASACSRACEQYVRRRRRLFSAQPPSRQCEVCETWFDPKRVDARFCSNSCRQWAYRRRSSAP
jgi:hypothetical protein